MGAFPLPDTDFTQIETDTNSNKLKQNPMGICVGVLLCVVWTPPIFYASNLLSVSVLGNVNTPFSTC